MYSRDFYVNTNLLLRLHLLQFYFSKSWINRNSRLHPKLIIIDTLDEFVIKGSEKASRVIKMDVVKPIPARHEAQKECLIEDWSIPRINYHIEFEEQPDEETLNRGHNDPDNWRCGLFYFNPLDKRVFVLKRNKWMGVTLNFAQFESHLIMALISGMIILLLIISK